MNNLSSARNENKKAKSTALIAINTILVLVILVLVFVIASINTLWAPYTVSGPSMENTFVDGDKVIIIKKGYSLDYGDIIIFNRNEDRKVIKRVIALPGDRIRYSRIEKVWYRNGDKLIEEYVNGEYPDSYLTATTTTDIEIYIALTSDEGLLVNENEVFVLGDNRKDSYDSHAYGSISQDLIIGKYLLKY